MQASLDTMGCNGPRMAASLPSLEKLPCSSSKRQTGHCTYTKHMTCAVGLSAEKHVKHTEYQKSMPVECPKEQSSLGPSKHDELDVLIRNN